MKGKKLLATMIAALSTVGIMLVAAACSKDSEKQNPSQNEQNGGNSGLDEDNETPLLPFN